MQSVLAISLYLLAHCAMQLVREKATGTRHLAQVTPRGKGHSAR